MTTGLPRGTCEAPTGSLPADAALEISRFGSAILRDVWDPDHLRTLRDAISEFCERREKAIALGKVDPVMQQYHEMGSTVLTWLIYEGLIDLEFLAKMFRGSFYNEVCKAHFDDDEFYLAPERIGSRNIRPPYSSLASLPFHQDSVEQDRRIMQVLNCWIPLDNGAGHTSPGVEVVRHPGRPKFPLQEATAQTNGTSYEAVAISRDRVIADYGDNFLAPSFALGDSFLFSQHVIHRTYVTPAMTEPRIGFEFRVFSLKHLAPWASPDEVGAQSFPLN